MTPDMATRLACAVAFDVDLPPAWQECGASRLLESLDSNRVPIAEVPAGQALEAVTSWTEVARFRDRHVRDRKQAMERYQELLEPWHERGVRPVLVKAAGFFPYNSDNLDVLVAPGEEEAAIEALLERGYVELQAMVEPHKRLFRRASGPPLGWALHLHTAVAWISPLLYGQDVVASAGVLAGTHGVLEPCREHALLISAAHAFYEDKELKIRDLYALRRCLAFGAEWAEMFRLAGDHGWDDVLEHWFRVSGEAMRALEIDPGIDRLPERAPSRIRRSWLIALLGAPDSRLDALPRTMPKTVCKSLHLVQAARDRTRPWRARAVASYRITRFALLVKIRPLIRQRFVVCAVSGPDGAGKTTLSQGLVTMCGLFGLKAYYHWTRPGSSRLLDTARRFVRSGRSADATGRTGADKAALQAFPAARRVWGIVTTVDYLVRAWLLWLIACVRGGVHVFDRYALDAAADIFAFYGVRATPLLLSFAPPAHVSVVLDPDRPARPFTATPVHPEFAARVLQGYREGAPRLQAGTILDPAETPEALLESVLRPVLSVSGAVRR